MIQSDLLSLENSVELNLKRITIFYLLFFATKSVAAFDCSNVPPFQAFERIEVSIQIDRFYWTQISGQKVEKIERVCKTSQPLYIGAYDIQNREKEWYYCFYKEPRPSIECNTTFQGRPAKIVVRPAVVIREFNSKRARDTHAHIFLLPEGFPERYFDTFVRSLSFDLKKQPVVIDSMSGGRGSDSNQDSFDVRLQFH
jgi:hypothetical protein